MSNYFQAVIDVERRKRVPAASGEGFIYVPDGIERVALAIEIDVQRLAKELGPRAVRSKGKKAVEAGGAVVVRVHSGRSL